MFHCKLSFLLLFFCNLNILTGPKNRKLLLQNINNWLAPFTHCNPTTSVCAEHPLCAGHQIMFDAASVCFPCFNHCVQKNKRLQSRLIVLKIHNGSD